MNRRQLVNAAANTERKVRRIEALGQTKTLEGQDAQGAANTALFDLTMNLRGDHDAALRLRDRRLALLNA